MDLTATHEGYFTVNNVIIKQLYSPLSSIFVRVNNSNLNIFSVVFDNLSSVFSINFLDTNYAPPCFFHVGSNLNCQNSLIRSCIGFARSIAVCSVSLNTSDKQQTNYTTLHDVNIKSDCIYMCNYGNIQFNYMNASLLKAASIPAPYCGYFFTSLYESFCTFKNLSKGVIYYHYDPIDVNNVTQKNIVLLNNHPTKNICQCQKTVIGRNFTFFGNDLMNVVNFNFIDSHYDQDIIGGQTENCYQIENFPSFDNYGADIILEDSLLRCKTDFQDYYLMSRIVSNSLELLWVFITL